MSEYVLFKFRKIDKYLLKALVQSEIYFARPDQLNDPFDCRVDLPNALENAISRAEGALRTRLEQFRRIERLLNDVQARLVTVGVCSFSLELNNSLMWAHYADNHCGMCLTYGFPETFFSENADTLLGVDEVDYGEHPLSTWFLETVPNLGSMDDFGTSLIKKALTVKAQPWHYEREIRIVRRTEGVHGLQKHQLKQVCFGLRTPDADLALVREVLNRCGYDASVCRIVRDARSDFGLDTVEI